MKRVDVLREDGPTVPYRDRCAADHQDPRAGIGVGEPFDESIDRGDEGVAVEEHRTNYTLASSAASRRMP